MPRPAIRILVLVLATAAPSWAQGAGPAAGRSHPAVEQRIDDLRRTLKITPAEQGAFDDFAQVMRDNAERMRVSMQKQRTAAGTNAVEQLQLYGAAAHAHAEDVDHLVPVFSRLYDSLAPDQKALADESFRRFVRGPAPRNK